MQNRNLFAFTVVGLAAAIAVPAVAFGNARNNAGGSNAEFHASQTPLVALLDGPSDLTTSGTITPTGDPDGTGSAAFTFVTTNAGDPVNGAQACFDLSYSNLTGTPTAAHIHRGAAGVGGPVVVIPPTLPNLGANSASGCVTIAPALSDEIKAT
ncbi:MAG TPA: CHRD domain-containing protein, partial [Ilumatobacteraceae bacterium]|nr:CHRD domain-containing protein [Ilumatobacteraceae bacterium]